jgi:hypothetical protein
MARWHEGHAVPRILHGEEAHRDGEEGEEREEKKGCEPGMTHVKLSFHPTDGDRTEVLTRTKAARTGSGGAIHVSGCCGGAQAQGNQSQHE